MAKLGLEEDVKMFPETVVLWEWCKQELVYRWSKWAVDDNGYWALTMCQGLCLEMLCLHCHNILIRILCAKYCYLYFTSLGAENEVDLPKFTQTRNQSLTVQTWRPWMYLFLRDKEALEIVPIKKRGSSYRQRRQFILTTFKETVPRGLVSIAEKRGSRKGTV